MPNRESPDPSKSEVAPEVVLFLEQLLATGAVGSAHYAGYAHEAVLRVLHRKFGTKFSVMDWCDRYGIGAAFFADSPDEVPASRRPEWLHGVAFSQEGRPRTDLLIWEGPWGEPSHSWEKLQWHRPKHLLLVGEAVAAAEHPDYQWTHFPGFAHGILEPQK